MLLPKSVMVGYGRHSETERVLVINDSLTNLKWLKIQSDVIRNYDDLSFDGDEMNMHMPQDAEAAAELRYLAAVPHQIISPANNASIIGIFQDSLLGSYRFTREGISFTPREAMNLLMGVNSISRPLFTSKDKMISNFELLSQVLPPMSIKFKNNNFGDDEDSKSSNNIIEIINGVMKRGQIDKSVKKMIHTIFNDFGYSQSADFIDNLQAIVTSYMKSSAFSVGISDLIADSATNVKIAESITNKKQQVKDIIDKVQIGVFDNNSGKSNEVEFETQVNNILNKAREEAGKIGRNSLDKNNRFVIMVNAGSKGSDINIAQMISCLGQQNVDGKRIGYGFEDRTLPHFHKFDDSPEARGFVENSFIQGLNPQELFFHAMGGRVGLIDTAVKSVTWDTPIVLIENNKPLYTKIGEWIDSKLDNKLNIEYVERHKERNLELLNTDNIFIPTTDEDGIVTWGSVTAITRHDPGTKLYEIKTLGGREVTVTESKSLLVWNPDTKKFTEMLTPDIKIGDALPVTETLCDPPIIINKYKDNILDYKFALEIMNSDLKNNTDFLLNYAIFGPTNFIKGIIDNWYIEENTYITNDKTMTNILSMLFSRIGISTNIVKNGIIINKNIITYNNCVLDKIVSINEIGVENNPKMYDLTIPSTLNFGLANGLQVRDTSSTGYIQRRLIKGMEDLKVEYDMTVRNNMNKIIQFQYGDDSFETTKVEGQSIPITKMTTEEIYAHYYIADDIDVVYTTETQKRVKKQQQQLKDIAFKVTQNMIRLRDEIIEKVFNFENETKINIPVNFKRIIENTQNQMNIQPKSFVDITPLEAFQTIEKCKQRLKNIKAVQMNQLFEATYDYYMNPKDLLIYNNYNKKSLDILCENIVMSYKKAIATPGEMVGMIAAQSIGEPTTQLTLNSVTYETLIPVRDSNGNMANLQIGDFVNEYINKCIGKKEYYESKDTTYAELDKDSQYYEILAPDENGEMMWCRIEAVTKHPVINEDGTNTMLKITTENEREVIVTKAKSLLKVVDGSLVASAGGDAKIGDYLPVNTMSYEHNNVYEIELKNILSPKEYLFMSEVRKALSYKDESFWWKKHNDIDFQVPYSRSDSFLDMVNKNILHTKKKNGTTQSVHYEYGNVYMKHNSRTASQIPEVMPLDYNFGYLVGAYCAEGCVTKTQISIANLDSDYLQPIIEFCEKYNITYKVYKQQNKNAEGWTSQDIRIYSKLLTELLVKLCNKISHTKELSDIIVYSNDECKRGYLDAYIGGDGTICKKSNYIVVSSTSKNLLEKTQCILNTYGIYSFIRKRAKQTSNNRGTKVFQQLYNLNVSNYQCNKLANLLNIKVKSKQELVIQKREYKPLYNINRINDKYLPSFNSKTETYELLPRDNTYKNIVFEKIKSIEEVPNTTDYAYDLTVETTRNFITMNGLAENDTFHSAGISSKSNVTRGVPRIEEVLSLSKEPKNPSITVYLKKQHQQDTMKAQQMMHILEHTCLKDVVASVSICFDPDNLNTLIEEDKPLIAQFREFETMFCDDEEESTENKSKWIIRMELDKEEMLDKNITMDDINYTISNSYNDKVECIYSDYNADKLIFRIRFTVDKKQNQSLDQSDEIFTLKNIQDNMLNNIILKGAKGIQKVIMRKVQNTMIKENGNYTAKDIWVLDTVGSNLLDILGMDGIDYTRTYSNNIIEMYSILGIEATRQAIYNELAEVVEFDGTYINYHHMALLADRMCCTKRLVSIFRHGINNDNIGPIAKASFEETPEMFLRAARHAEFDNMKGVSANVMCGQQASFGTNAFQLVLDIPQMAKLGSKTVTTETTSMDSLFNIEDKNDKCSIQNIQIEHNINNLSKLDMGDDNDYDLDI